MYCSLAINKVIKMQTLRFRSGFSLTGVNKYQVRCRAVAVNVSPVNNEVIQNLKSWKEIPGPKSYPLIGTLPNYLPRGELHGYRGLPLYEKLFKKYGPIVRLEGTIGSPNMVFLFDPNIVADVLRSENTLPIRPGFFSLDYYRKRYNKRFDPQRQTGLLTEHGEKWKDFRAKVNHILLQPKTIKLYHDVLAEVADDMVVRMKSNRDENNMIKKRLDVEVNLWALESIGVVAFGTRLNCFNPNLPKDSAARKLIQNIHDLFIFSEKVDYGISLWRYVSTPNFRKVMEIYAEQERLTKLFIDNAIKDMESKKNESNNSDSEKPILQKLLEIDVNVALVMASDLLTAGVDTVANTVLATFYLLAKNPEKQEKLRIEVKKKQRPYLRACVKESMRMMPVANANLRAATKDYNVNGYKIPKDMLVIFGHILMSNMKEQYPNPDEYIPERWIAEKDDPLYYGNAHPFASNPFGFGVRMCVARRIAELEIDTFVAKVVENFEIGWTGGTLNISAQSLNYITGPFNFVFKDV